MHGDAGLRMQGIDRLPAWMTSSPQVQDDDVAMHLGKPADLIDEQLLLREIQIDPLRHVGQLEDASTS